MNELLPIFADFFKYTGLVNVTFGHIFMICIGLAFIALAIVKKWVPMLLIPIGFGILIGNIPLFSGLHGGINDDGSALNILYSGIKNGWYPALLFLGIGAMTDFSSLISNPKLFLIGAAAQTGIFGAYILSVYFGFMPNEAASIGIIGGANGPTAIFLSSELAPNIICIVAILAYLYMALSPLIQLPLMKLFTTPKERVIRMKPPRAVSQTEKILFPIVGFVLICLLIPATIPLLGMLFLGNLLKESGVTRRLAETAKGPMLDIVTILIGITIGASAQATTFLKIESLKILCIGAISFVIATIVGILFVKLMNIFLKQENKINPLIGNAGVSAFPESAHVSQLAGERYDPSNHLLMHATGANVAGVIGSVIAAGILLGYLG